jgi:ABC-2 type transport system ATP-binding protein
VSTTAPLAAADQTGSTEAAITTSSLTKTFGKQPAVRNLTIEVPRHKIVGFVGPNGSGKTTTIRMLLGLIRPTSGTGRVLGGSIDDPALYLERVGALIETPAFYPTLSGRANLAVLASLGGICSRRIPELIETVGLAGRERDKVGKYSLGMKQRLGIAAALLPDPELLVLDEPANGLDPAGIIEMRELLRSLRDQGKTVFISSHLLGELEHMADWMVVLKEGEAAYAGPTVELTNRSAGGILLSVESPDQMEKLQRIVMDLGYQAHWQDAALRVSAPREAAGEINRQAMNVGVTLTEIQHLKSTLEDIFLAMISGDDHV